MGAVADGFSSLGTLIFVAGALGVAAMGLADSLKLFAWVGRAGFGELFVGLRDARKRLGLIPAAEQESSRADDQQGLRADDKAVGRVQIEKVLPVGGALLEPLAPAYDVAYGSDWLQVLEGAWRSGRSTGELPRLLRQGVRLGVSELARREDGASKLTALCTALRYGTVVALRDAYTNLVNPKSSPDENELSPGENELSPGENELSPGENELSSDKKAFSDADREAIGRFEALVDARIDAALGLAETRYQRLIQLLAAVIALALALLIAFSWPDATTNDPAAAEATKNAAGVFASPIAFMLFAGVLAIPLAPTAKNIASALDEAVTRLRGGTK